MDYSDPYDDLLNESFYLIYNMTAFTIVNIFLIVHL